MGSALRAEWLSGGEHGFDGFVAENEEGSHRPETGQERLVAAGVADPADDVFAAEFLQMAPSSWPRAGVVGAGLVG